MKYIKYLWNVHVLVSDEDYYDYGKSMFYCF